MAKDLLIEIGTEELPPKALHTLSTSFGENLCRLLEEAFLGFESSELFATPRRLAIKITGLQEKQTDQIVEKLGPAVQAAFDKEGKPSKAAEGFANSHGVSFAELQQVATDKGDRLAYKSIIAGQATTTLLPGMIETALASLPIPKRMRWGAKKVEFVRPIHWIVLLFGEDIIASNIMGITAGNQSRGHRFHAPDPFTVAVNTYADDLTHKKVIASFAKRRAMIVEQITTEAKKINGTAVIDDNLLDEVTGLVEWPVALMGNFEKRFLDVPAQALISSMKEHQKYFHLLDATGKLLPNFITISNIESNDKSQVINGNERVIRPRLSDAAFFFETDKKKTLAARCESLKSIVFQKQLGTVYDKTLRVAKLAAYIAKQIDSDQALAERAALLSKSDLVSEMVLEFTDLQGIMGYHYALHDGEHAEVATALYEQYLPKSADDDLPETLTGCALALADRIDTLMGIFGIGQQPTGNKDPFALRRTTLGILNIIIGKTLNLDLYDLYVFAFEQYTQLPAKETVQQTLEYTIERLRAYYQARDIQTEVYLSVAARNIYKPLDFDKRIKAVYQFSKLEESTALAAANKRVANILAKQQDGDIASQIDATLLHEDAEKALAASLDTKAQILDAAIKAKDYQGVLSTLATLKPEIDAFFDSVMVMTEDIALRNNRLAILQKIRTYFLQVADISLLAVK